MPMVPKSFPNTDGSCHRDRAFRQFVLGRVHFVELAHDLPLPVNQQRGVIYFPPAIVFSPNTTYEDVQRAHAESRSVTGPGTDSGALRENSSAGRRCRTKKSDACCNRAIESSNRSSFPPRSSAWLTVTTRTMGLRPIRTGCVAFETSAAQINCRLPPRSKHHQLHKTCSP